MTLPVFQNTLVEIVKDLGGGYYGGAVADVANSALAEAMQKNRDGRHQSGAHFWMGARAKDFTDAVEILKPKFLETTTERIMSVNDVMGGKVFRRPSAIWLEGKVYRVALARVWGYQDGDDLKWAAEITPFARVTMGFPRWGLTPAQRKKMEADAPSEYLAEKNMVRLFEDAFRTTLA